MKPSSAINIINLFINYAAPNNKKGMKIKINIIMLGYVVKCCIGTQIPGVFNIIDGVRGV